MNIQPYRQSFTVFIVDSDVERGTEVFRTLNGAGYSVEHMLQMQSLIEEVKKTTPHVIIFNLSDKHAYVERFKFKTRVEQIKQLAPNVHIIVLHDQMLASEASSLYEFSIYDTVIWPSTQPFELLKSVDRAAECDYYMYLNEQMREDHDLVSQIPGQDFAMYTVWLKELERCQTPDQTIGVWLKEAMRFFGTDCALFFKYVDSKKTLIVHRTVGNLPDRIIGTGIDLETLEPGFKREMLKSPQNLRSLHSFLMHGLNRDQAAFYPLFDGEQMVGIGVVPARPDQTFSSEKIDNGYIKTCSIMFTRHLVFQELRRQLVKFSVYDHESEALNNDFLLKKIKEEISRARRIVRPFSLILITINSFQDMNLTYEKEQMKRFLRSFAELLSLNSRLNDLVGRYERDKFIVCLPHTPFKGAIVKAERFRRLIESADFSVILQSQKNVTVTVGISEYPRFCHDGEGLVGTAEAAMYNIKKDGKQKIALATVASQFVPDFIVQDE